MNAIKMSASDQWSIFRIVTLALGPVVGFLLWLFFRPTGQVAEVNTGAAVVIGLLGWMTIWWATQAVELAITGLLPVVILPVFSGSKVDLVLAPYANDVIFLFAGGCVLGIAIQRHGLGLKFLQFVIRIIGDSPGRIVASFLFVAAFMSAWVSNTATAAMMLPLGIAAISIYSIENKVDPAYSKASANFQKAILLAIAYGASIGGVMTVLGSPPNPIAVEWINTNGGEMDFVRWVSVGVPAAVLMMIAALFIFRWSFPLYGLPIPVRTEADAQNGSGLSRAAKLTLIIFLVAVVAWICTPFIKSVVPNLILKDGIIAIAAALALFILPAERGSMKSIVPWSETQKLPWGVFILFGGGLTLAEAMQRTGVSQMIAESVTGMDGLPEPLVIAAIAAVLIFASEVASNTALAATAVPIVGAMAPGLGIPPEKLVVAAVLGASLAFMLPVGTPPNALVFSTGLVPVKAMFRVGFILNLCAIVVITIVCTWLM